MSTPVGVVLTGLFVLGSVGAAVRVVQIGHSGAEATWSSDDVVAHEEQLP